MIYLRYSRCLVKSEYVSACILSVRPCIFGNGMNECKCTDCTGTIPLAAAVSFQHTEWYVFLFCILVCFRQLFLWGRGMCACQYYIFGHAWKILTFFLPQKPGFRSSDHWSDPVGTRQLRAEAFRRRAPLYSGFLCGPNDSSAGMRVLGLHESQCACRIRPVHYMQCMHQGCL